MQTVSHIAQAPKDLFDAAVAEVSEGLEWKNAKHGGKKFPVVSTFNLLAPVEAPAVRDLIEWVKTELNALSTGLLLITKLPAGEMIDSHINDDQYSTAFNRYHLPLVTDSEVKIINTETNEEQHMEAGHLYLLNRVEHSVVNLSEVDRIHLIVDATIGE